MVSSFEGKMVCEEWNSFLSGEVVKFIINQVASERRWIIPSRLQLIKLMDKICSKLKLVC
ncbi:MAG: hypothetical protein ACTS80_00280 [Candidatus Hodgkinia cicadicola]